ncbi:restriction endonuclease [Nocardia sp. NPDC004568]|uniref:restriction endonuclease n=1 Tax=Nocardia sp. NPDC004568 TaxID=3154551 RepID=UPI0033AE9236
MHKSQRRHEPLTIYDRSRRREPRGTAVRAATQRGHRPAPLGLDRIYAQAKCYDSGNTVGRPALQKLVGALHGVGAARGVFITTSAFSQGTRGHVQNIPARVVLITASGCPP